MVCSPLSYKHTSIQTTVLHILFCLAVLIVVLRYVCSLLFLGCKRPKAGSILFNALFLPSFRSFFLSFFLSNQSIHRLEHKKSPHYFSRSTFLRHPLSNLQSHRRWLGVFVLIVQISHDNTSAWNYQQQFAPADSGRQ